MRGSTPGRTAAGVTDPSLRSTRGKAEWLIFAIIVQGLLTAFGITREIIEAMDASGSTNVYQWRGSGRT